MPQGHASRYAIRPNNAVPRVKLSVPFTASQHTSVSWLCSLQAHVIVSSVIRADETLSFIWGSTISNRDKIVVQGVSDATFQAYYTQVLFHRSLFVDCFVFLILVILL